MTATEDGQRLGALAAAIRDLTVAAGAAILRVYATPFATRAKNDRSPVTDADIAAEAIILAGLAELTPDLPVVAEESVAAGRRPDLAGRRYWLVDPLDGTVEFVDRNGEFTVNIALIENNRPLLGVVYVPLTGTSYIGERGGRAFRQDGDGPYRTIAAVPAPADGFRVLTSRNHRTAATDDWLKSVKVKQIAVCGSSVKFCRIAEGAADLYPRLGPTNEWDIAAGHAVLAAAGGSVRDLAGADLAYGKPDFRNPSFIARGRD